MKRNEDSSSNGRVSARKEIYFPIVSGICLFLSVLLLFNQFRLYQTVAAFVHGATETAPSVVWYEEETQSTQPPESTVFSENVQIPENAVDGKTYVLNTASMKIHSPTCRYAVSMNTANKQVVTDKTLEELLSQGYSKCAVCNAE